MGQELLEQALVEAKCELEAAEPSLKKNHQKRVQMLQQCLDQGAELHSDGYIRYPNKPTLLGYD